MEERTPSAKPRRGDIRDVAQLARVSISTVSRVTNGKSTVNQEMAERVWRAVRELNYQPDAQARALVSGRSRIIGLMVTEITNPFFPELIHHFEQIAVRNGYEVLLASTPGDPADIAVSVRRMLQRKVDGVAVMMFGREITVLNELTSHNVPLVVIDGTPGTPNLDSVRVNYEDGILQAVRHLVALGHEDIAFISGPLEQKSARLRREAFESAVAACQRRIAPRLMIEGDHTLEGGIAAMAALFALPQPPTAVLCSNDMTAIGVLHGMFESGKQVPADLSVIGFDDVHIAQYMLPPLTTIRMSCEEIAQAAFSTLRQRIEDPITSSAAPAVRTTLIKRQTTAPPPGKTLRPRKTSSTK